MFRKLFSIAVVVFLVIVSLAVFAFLFRGLLSSAPLMTDSSGITVVAGGASEKWLRLVFLLTVLIGVSYLYWRGRRKPR